MSFFLDYVRVKIELRRKNLEVFIGIIRKFYIFLKKMKGTYDNEKKFFSLESDLNEDDLLKANEFQNITLKERFVSAGYPYTKETKTEKNISYREVERVLILFQSYFKVNYLFVTNFLFIN